MAETALTFTYGEVRIDHVELVHDYPQMKLWAVHCKSKYPEQWVTWTPDEGHEIMFTANEHTLRTDEDRQGQGSLVKLGLDSSWVVHVNGARYTFYITAWQWPNSERVD